MFHNRLLARHGPSAQKAEVGRLDLDVILNYIVRVCLNKRINVTESSQSFHLGHSDVFLLESEV